MELRDGTGIGSKLMAKMGYVFGSGLGKNGEGRVEPVDIEILPPGRSLDTIMNLKEKMGGSTANLFTAERYLKRLQRREKVTQANLEKRLHKSESVFNFLNAQLNLKKGKNSHSASEVANCHPYKESCKTLNKKMVSVGDRIRQVERDITGCKEAVKRHEGRDQTTVDRMKQKLSELQTHLVELKKSEVNISSEQRHRSDKKKLTVF